MKEHKRRWTEKSRVFQSFCVCGSLDATQCDACCWFTVGLNCLIEDELVEEELVEEGREEMAEHHARERQSIGF